VSGKEKSGAGFAAGWCLLFIVLGLAVIRYPGIQNDEALFGCPLLAPRFWRSYIRLFHHDIPTMVMSYVGTLKSLIYWPWFHLWPPSAMSIRLPALLIGAASVWLSFFLARRMGGRRVAIVSTALLATDVSFLLTNCFDWGPVALQHLFLVAGTLLVVRFHQDGRDRDLYAAFFLFGLGLWDKELFVWMLAGLAAGVVIVFPKEIAAHWSLRRAGLSVVCLLAGAFPLVHSSLIRSGDTALNMVSFSLSGMEGKIDQLRWALNGEVMKGLGPTDAPKPRSPHTGVELAAVALQKVTGNHFRNGNLYAFLAAVVLLPFLWRTPARRPMLFALIFLIVTWAQMAVTVKAGGSVHHVILLWPFPLLFIALAFVEAAGRLGRFGKPLLAVAVTVVAVQNVLIYNTILTRLIRNGSTGGWTDAIYLLSDRLQRIDASEIEIADWGTMNSLRLLGRGRLPLEERSFLLDKPEWTEGDRRILLAAISDPGHVFVGHVPAQEVFRGIGAKLQGFAQAAGYERMPPEQIADRCGRPVFEVFRFQRAEAKQR
jgi:4-amino-4-deoxy-L-arabinose transferase-like glycosyltransferase